MTPASERRAALAVRGLCEALCAAVRVLAAMLPASLRVGKWASGEEAAMRRKGSLATSQIGGCGGQ